MNAVRIGIVLYLIGVVIMAGDVFYGRTIQTEVTALGIAGIQAKYGNAGGLKLLAFAFGFPLGVGLSLLGAALLGGTAKTRPARLGGWALLVILVPILTPGILGTSHSPGYFGIGGITILGLVAASMWYWGRFRVRLDDARRPAADWQGLGYLAFALAAWNLCGFGGMPSFAVYPEKMIALNAIPFAVGQLKAVMALFILGWAFTAFGLYRASRGLNQP
jgi:hypothetical protein